MSHVIIIISNGPLSLGPGKRDRSIVFQACQLGVLAIRLITPLSYAYLLLLVALSFQSNCTWFQNGLYIFDISGRCSSDATFVSFGRLFLSHFQYLCSFCTSQTRLLFFMWMMCEVVFFPYYYFLYLRLSKQNDGLSHFATKKNERIQLAEKCFNVTFIPSTPARKHS